VKDSYPLVSVIIPTLNEEQYIEKALSLFRKQNYSNLEIIVVDGGSLDNTVRKAMEHARVVVSDRPGVAHQLNLGFRHIKGEIITFQDPDVKPSPDWLEKIVRQFEKDKDLIAVTGPLYATADSPFWVKIEYRLWNVIRFLYSLFPRPFGMFFATRVTTVVRKSVFEKVGGFDESLLVNEDGDLGKRLMGVGKVKFCWSLYQHVIPRRAKSAVSFNTHYLYILGNMFPFNLLPERIWKVIRLRSGFKFLQGAQARATQQRIQKRIEIIVHVRSFPEGYSDYYRILNIIKNLSYPCEVEIRSE